jgi:uncharacterized protein (TIGR02246 family)
MTSSTGHIHEALKAANERFMAAFARGDAAGLAALYTENGQVLPPNSQVVEGRDAVQGFWQAVMDMGIKGARLETVEVEGHGDTAVEVGRFELLGEGEQILDRGKYIVLWQRDGREWKLHRDIFNSSQPAG